MTGFNANTVIPLCWHLLVNWRSLVPLEFVSQRPSFDWIFKFNRFIRRLGRKNLLLHGDFWSILIASVGMNDMKFTLRNYQFVDEASSKTSHTSQGLELLTNSLGLHSSRRGDRIPETIYNTTTPESNQPHDTNSSRYICPHCDFKL